MSIDFPIHINDEYNNSDISDITEYKFTVTFNRVTPFSQIYWAFNWWFSDGAVTDGYTGYQPGGLAPITGDTEPLLNFSVWNATTAMPGPGSTATSFGGEGVGERIAHPELIANGVSYTIDLKINDGVLTETQTDQSGNVTIIGSIPAPASSFSSAAGFSYFTEYFGGSGDTTGNPALLPSGEVEISNVLVDGIPDVVNYGTTVNAPGVAQNSIPFIQASGPGGYYDTSTGPAGSTLTLHLASQNATIVGGSGINRVQIVAGFGDLAGDTFNNIQQLDGGGQTLTMSTDQFDSFNSITNANGGIVLTGSGTHTLYLTPVQLAADATALQQISTGFTVIQVAEMENILVTAVSPVIAKQYQTIIITGQDLGTQYSYKGNSAYVEFTDITKNWSAGYKTDLVTLGIEYWSDTKIVLSGFYGYYGSGDWVINIGDNFSVNIWNPQTGSEALVYQSVVVAATESASQAIQAYTDGTLAAALQIADKAVDIQANLDALQAIVASGTLVAISLTDTGTSTMSITATQLNNDYETLQNISDGYDLTVTGGPISAAAAAAEQTHLTYCEVSDSAANIAGYIDALQSLVVAGKLTSIALTGSGFSTLSILPDQLTSDAAALASITGNFVVAENASAANLTFSGLASHGNTALFSGTAAEYSVAATSNGEGVSVTDTGTGTGRTSVDILSNVIALQFSDFADIVAETPGTATVTSGNITELYGAAFGRPPDVAGLAYYENELQNDPSLPLTQFAQNFLGSPEYVNNPAHNYAPTIAGDTQFITDCYQNLLHRSQSASETNYYLAVISQFTKGLTAGTSAFASAEALAHAYVVTDFSQSPEFLSDVTVTLQTPSSASHWLVLI
jgi:hypothetical protein